MIVVENADGKSSIIKFTVINRFRRVGGSPRGKLLLPSSSCDSAQVYQNILYSPTMAAYRVLASHLMRTRNKTSL
jgi:hypothetical protein